MALTGAMIQARGAVLPTLEGFFVVPEWQLGLVAPAGTVGYLLVVVVFGTGAGHFDARRLLAVGAFGAGVALLAMGLAPSFLFFLGAIVVRGAMTGFLRGLDRPLLSHLYPSNRGRLFNLYDGTWAVGAASGPLAVVVALRLGSWRLVYAALAVALFVLAVLFWRLESPTVESKEQPLTRARLGELLRQPEVIALLAALFLVTGVEGGLFTWLPYYANGELPGGWAEVTLTAMLVAYVPGRFAYSALTERVGPLNLLIGVLGLLLPAFAFTFFVADGLWVLAGVVAVGLLISGVFPTMMAYATDAVPEYSGPVNALATGTASVAVGSVPAVMGVVVGGSDAATAMRLLLAPLAAALGVVVLARIGPFYVFESNLLFFFIYESVFMVFVNLKRRVGEGIYKAEAPIGFTLLSLLRPKPQ
ncbi:MFS transporter [Halobacteriales archaeon QH_8_67_27]|nr:MAG: MFS transporter [Halobacteriales archaeon QH_8_67_27]